MTIANAGVGSGAAGHRVAILSSEFPPKWGGVGNEVFFQVNHLAKAHGLRFDVFTRQWQTERPQLADGVRLHEVPWRKLPMAFALSFGRNAITRVVHEQRNWDICHVHSNMTLLPRQAYDDVRIPLVSSLHGTWQGERSELRLRDIAPNLRGVNDLAVMVLSPSYDEYEDFAISLSDIVLVECEQEMQAIERRDLDIQGELVKLAPGVDTELFRPELRDPASFARLGIPVDGPKALFVGRLAGRKGLDDLVKIFGIASGKVDGLRLLVVGTGPLEARLRRQFRRAGLAEKVHFLRDVPLSQLASLYASADLVLYPTRWEGFGLVPLEGMAAGTPAVASGVGGIPEYIRHGESGFVEPVGAVEEMAQHVITLATDRELQRKLGSMGRAEAERRSLTAWAERVYAIYQRLAVNGGKIRKGT